MKAKLAATPAKTYLAALLFYAALTPIMTYPMALHLADAVPGPPWDNFVWLYDLWWFKHSLIELGVSPWFNPQMFHPFGYEVGLSETILASKAIGLPFLLLGGEVVAFNALVWASFILSGFTMYLLVLRQTRNTWAALLSGVIYAFAPYRMHALAAGWIPLLPTQWLPLTILYLERTLAQRRARSAALAGFFAALSALSSWYYAYMLAIILPVYVLARARPWRAHLGDRRLWRAGAAFALVVVVMTIPVILPALGLSSQSWSLGYADRWSASLDDFVLPNVYHPLWGRFFLSLRAVAPEYPWYAPGFIYLGAAPLMLAIVALIGARTRRGSAGVSPADKNQRAGSRSAAETPALQASALLWSGVVSAVLALGTTLHVFGARVYLPVAGWIEQQFSRVMIVLASRLALHKAIYSSLRAADSIPVVLPGFFAFLFLPLFSAMRHFYRFGIITTLVVAVLAGMGAAILLRRAAGRSALLATWRVGGRTMHVSAQAALGGVLLLVTLFDFLSAPLPYGLSYTSVQQPVDLWLAAQPDDGAVMQFPLVRALNGPMLYRGIAHGKKMTYAHGTFYPPIYVEAEKTLGRFPEAASLDLLRDWGVRYVLVGSRAYTEGWGDLPGQTWHSIESDIAASERLALVEVFDEQPFWKDEWVSGVLQKELTPDPISVDRVYVYELVR
jgi:hypothetical protein